MRYILQVRELRESDSSFNFQNISGSTIEMDWVYTEPSCQFRSQFSKLVDLHEAPTEVFFLVAARRPCPLCVRRLVEYSKIAEVSRVLMLSISGENCNGILLKRLARNETFPCGSNSRVQ